MAARPVAERDGPCKRDITEGSMKATISSAIQMLTAAAAIGAMACSGSKMPTAPSTAGPVQSSAAPAPSASAAGGATISGVVVGAGGGMATAAFRAQSAPMTVTVVGTSVSSLVDATSAFALRGVPAGTVHLQFSGTSAQVEVADVVEHQEIHITVVLGPGAAEVDNDERETPDNRVEIEGRISAIAGTTIRVSDKDVSVPAGTPIQHGGTALAFADLHAGDRVHVHAMKSGATVVATSIEDQTSNPSAPPVVTPPPPAPGNGDDHGNGGDHNGQVQVSGAIAGRSGACPSIAFSLGSTSVATNAATEFKDVTCSALANGTRVEVKGTRQSNGAVLAARVEKTK